MLFKNQRKNSQLPEVNLVPLMDVMMSVLTFFIITSMSYTSQRLGTIELPGLPGTGTSSHQASLEKPLVIGLDQDGKILLDNQVITVNQLTETLRAYFKENPEQTVLLNADRQLPYNQVEEILKKMSKVGGNRVSLTVENR